MSGLYIPFKNISDCKYCHFITYKSDNIIIFIILYEKALKKLRFLFCFKNVCFILFVVNIKWKDIKMSLILITYYF